MKASIQSCFKTNKLRVFVFNLFTETLDALENVKKLIINIGNYHCVEPNCFLFNIVIDTTLGVY